MSLYPQPKQLRKGLSRGASAGRQLSAGCHRRANGKVQTAYAFCIVDDPVANGFTEAGGFESCKRHMYQSCPEELGVPHMDLKPSIPRIYESMPGMM